MQTFSERPAATGRSPRVAAVAVERGAPFVCVPFGTRNHFARDLGLDRGDPVAALDAFAGEERRIDMGRAGERRFLNNVSLGLYASLVHRRERHRRRGQVLAGARRSGAACVTDGRSGPSSTAGRCAPASCSSPTTRTG